MANNKMLDDETEETVETSKDRKKDKKDKKDKKADKRKKKSNDDLDDGEEKETAGGRIVLFLIALLILLIWLAIIAVLIKADVGGFGSSVLYPVLKDVPYVNKILPTVEAQNDPNSDKYNFDSIEAAVKRIKELEVELDNATTQNDIDQETISQLQEQVNSLSSYKTEQDEFEKLKDQFYQDMLYYTQDGYDLYSKDTTAVLEAYKQYFESVDPDTASTLYKQVVEQLQNAEDYDDFVNKYANMKAKNAAAIFDEAQTAEDMQLVADILNHMDVQSAADILGLMDTKLAFNLTYLLKPELR